MAEFLDTFDVERQSLLEALDHVQDVWERFQQHESLEVEGSELSGSLISGELAMVRSELEAAQFAVGIFGLIKRGKSTLLNAMIGREVSSMHVTPETAVPVYVSYGQTPGAEVHFADGNIKHVAVEDVHEFTSQKTNANNQLGVTHVQQHVPVSFLRNGTCLVDTPGLDDADADEVYTERTLQELDLVDAGIVVFLSPPTVSATEMGFLTEVVARDLEKTFLVCNMYPQHFHDPATRREVLNYVGGRVVQATRRAGASGQVRIYPVCALEAWEARIEEDIDKWKRSGADRLLRDLELCLASSTGVQVLDRAAERIMKVARMARGEVQVRRQLLSDPQRLSEFRAEVDGRVTALEREFDQAVRQTLEGIEPLTSRVRGRALEPFKKARREVQELDSVDEVEQWVRRFRRELEVAGESASRTFSAGFRGLVEQLRERLQDRFHAVTREITPHVPRIELSVTSLVMSPDQLRALEDSRQRARQTGRTGAVAGGLAGGAVTLVAGAALLGPLGLLGGALAGWQLSSMVSSERNLRRAQQTILERLDTISEHLLADLDEQVTEATKALREGVDTQRRAFAADLYQQFDLVQAISQSPDLLERQRRAAERFMHAFDVCADKARNSVVNV